MQIDGGSTIWMLALYHVALADLVIETIVSTWVKAAKGLKMVKKWGLWKQKVSIYLIFEKIFISLNACSAVFFKLA